MKLTPQQLAQELSHSEFVYKGYSLSHSEDVEEDCVKLWHHVVTPDGELHYADWSPYERMTEVDFMRWVDLGCPPRLTWGPLNRNDLTVLEQRAKLRA
jgi:hypothetical protein